MMKRLIPFLAAAALLAACTANVDIESIPVADSGQISRVEPPCWWTGMKTDLVLMVH